MKISACLIAKNEERCIGRCLESLKSIIDELIVVDTGSSDKTIEIAESYGAKIFHFEWIDDFAAARNYAIEQASGDWIIFLDADEWLRSKQDAANLKRLIKEAHKSKRAFCLLLKLIDIMDTDTGETGLNMQLPRVFRNGPACRYQRAIHEYIQVPQNMQAIYNQDLDITIMHDGYRKQVVKDKIERNNVILLRELENNPEDNMIYYYLGDACRQMKEYQKAYDYLIKYVESESINLVFGIRGILGAFISSQEIGLPSEKRRELADYAVKMFPDHPTTYVMLSMIDYEEKKYDAMLKNNELAIEKRAQYSRTIEVSSNMLDDNFPAVHFNAATGYALKNQPEKAIECYCEALMADKRMAPAMEGLALLLSRGDQKEFIKRINSIFPNPTREDFEFFLPSMRRNRPREAFLTCFEKFFNMTKTPDINFHVMLAIIGNYRQSFDGLKQRYELSDRAAVYLTYIVGMAIASGDSGMMNEAAGILDGRYGEIIGRYRLNEPARLFSAEQAAFHAEILGHMVAMFGPVRQVLKWAGLDQSAAGQFNSGVILFKNLDISEALEFILASIETGQLAKSLVTDAYFYAMRCYLHLADRQKALQYLQLYTENGGDESEAANFGKWIEQLD